MEASLEFAAKIPLTISRIRLEKARAASRLGDAGININYGYCGTEAVTNASILIFGVAASNAEAG